MPWSKTVATTLMRNHYTGIEASRRRNLDEKESYLLRWSASALQASRKFRRG
jgi:hypothetical protein